MGKLSLVAVLLILAIALSFGNKLVLADEWFDMYYSVSWHEERAHLANFSTYLIRHRDYIGYIAACSNAKDEKKVRARLKRASKFILSHFDIRNSQIRVIYAKNCKEEVTILQPLSQDTKTWDFFGRADK
jgi:hypothetical protein